MKKMLFILNPCAGTRKANKVLPEILSVFNRAEFDVRVYITEKQKDATRAVKALSPGMDLVVCCGGDGTFNETVTGLLEAGLDLPIGYIPAGSTNDFASSLHLPADPIAAAQAIVSGQPECYDVGRFGSRYFSYVASFGAFTKASYATPQNVKNALGHTAYILGSIPELSQIRKEHVRVELDGEVLEDDYLFGAICNSTSIGGLVTLDPKQVDMGDGMFEILLVRAPHSMAELTECILAVQKQQYNCKMMTFRSTREVVIHASPNMNWTLDGEKEDGHDTVTVTNLHHAIHLMK
ncbi:MAG: YegS/Rv2252/BmrU family lipid kinase [Oscillospiraceae bacterium]|nr:YegS/Rv2252/BmrU family lipid kinase [Oscillospiraceae bacterium]